MIKTDPTDIEKHEHATWEAAAGLYIESMGFMTAESGQLEIAVEVGQIDSRSYVLDVGCGPGILSAQLAKHAGHVSGIDFSEKMVTAARAENPSLNFEVANAEKLPFPDSSFNTAVCCYTAHHFARPVIVFDEIARVLKPGGRIVIIHPIQAEQASFGSFVEALYEYLPPEQLPSGPLFNVTAPEEYVNLLEKCGYVQVQCEKRLKPVKMRDIKSLLDAGWKIGNLAVQPLQVQEKIKESTIANASKHKSSDGGYSFPDMVLVATGCKQLTQ